MRWRKLLFLLRTKSLLGGRVPGYGFPMHLEDHVGDAIRKARAMRGVSAAGAANAAGWSETELAVVEDRGEVSRRPNFPALADVTGLSAAKLEGRANGWRSPDRDLSGARPTFLPFDFFAPPIDKSEAFGCLDVSVNQGIQL